MRVRRTAVGTAASALVALLALTALLAPPRGAAVAGPGGPAVGVQVHGTWADYDDASLGRVLDALAGAGVGWVRVDVSWAMLQPDGRGSWSSWGVGRVDRVITAATRRGLTPLVTLWLTPAWANQGLGERVLPDDPADYAAAAGWAAARWRGQVGAWEVWNEPNSGDFLVGADPVGYTRLLRAAYPALKAGDPAAPVVLGGTMYNDVGWLRRAYAAGAHGAFDVLATHPYPAPSDAGPERDDGTLWSLPHVRAVRDLMVAHGDGGKPVWFTEVGWSTHANVGDERPWQRGVTRQQQADLVVRTLRLVRDDLPWVTHVFFYTERDGATGDAHQDGFGLLQRDLTPKPALAALRGWLARPAARPAQPVARVVPCPAAVTGPLADPLLCPAVTRSR